MVTFLLKVPTDDAMHTISCRNGDLKRSITACGTGAKGFEDRIVLNWRRIAWWHDLSK